MPGGTNTVTASSSNNWRIDDISLSVFTTTLPPPVITSSLTASGSVGTPFSYNIVATNTPSSYTASPLPAGLSLSGSTISGTPTTASTTNVTLTATSGSGSDTKTLVITLGKGNQTITFNTLSARTYGDAPFTLNGTASSALTVSYSSSNTSVATVFGNIVTIVGAGTTTITASQAGDANWNAATSADQVLTVNKANQTISFGPLADKNDTDVPFALNGTASSGLTVSYSSSNASVATVSGNTVTITGPGITTITASQVGNANYNAATSVSQTQSVINTSLQNQTITFNALSPVTYGDSPFTLGATASSGLTVSYLSSNTSVATVSGNTVTIVAPGTTIITALQGGNGTYNPAPNVTQSLVVNTKALTITGAVAQNKVFDSLTVAVITGGTLNGIVGTDNVTFSGGGTFASSNVGTGIVVTANFSLGGTDASKYNLTQPTGLTANITQASQSITFGAIPTHLSTDGTFNPGATATSGLAISYSSSNTAVATTSGSTVTIVGPGSATITATQAGDINYQAATAVTQSLHVLAVVAKWTFEGVVTTNNGASPTFSSGSSVADLGTQTTGSQVTAVHASAGTTWSNVTGNASVKSLSANTWAVGDYFQFKVDLTGYYSIVLKYDQTGSNTGPISFKLQYSLNGTSFTDFQTYNIPTNATAAWGWSATTLRSESVQLFDLSTITALNGQPAVYFRVVDNGTAAINGTTVASGGTSRIDNFTVISEQCPITINTGTYSALCSNSSPLTLNGTPAGGTWTGTGVSGTVGSGFTFNPASGTQTLTYTYDNGTCSKSATTLITVNTAPTVSFSGFSGSTYCQNNGTATLTANQAGGTFSGAGITDNGNGTASWSAAAAGAGTFTITYTYNNSTCSNSTTQSVTVTVCNSIVTVKAFLQGFYTSSNLMAATLSDLGIVTNDITATDTVEVNLWSAASLANAAPDYSRKVILHTNGIATGAIFPGTTLGNSYYIAIKHRNSIETWSAAPVLITAATEYDFRSSLGSAFGDGINPPMKSLGGGIFGIYSGDANQDGTIDGADQAIMENDASAFTFGYNASDCTGDGATDSGDQTIIENNANLFLFYARPF